MFKLKYTPLVSLFLVIATLSIQLMVGSVSAAVPAGCPGGPMGPPSPGTVCPDGSTPLKDGSLPYGCPGSSQQGPVAGNYTTQCPARPGREACTYSQSTGKCTTASGQNVTPGTPAASTTTSANSSGKDCKAQGGQLTPQNCAILAYIVDAINILSALVGVVIVIMIAVGGLQYSASRDNPQATAAAKQKIINALLALVFFIFGFALLQYLVPGGIFR